jgi:hypothetical protein
MKNAAKFSELLSSSHNPYMPDYSTGMTAQSDLITPGLNQNRSSKLGAALLLDGSEMDAEQFVSQSSKGLVGFSKKGASTQLVSGQSKNSAIDALTGQVASSISVGQIEQLTVSELKSTQTKVSQVTANTTLGSLSATDPNGTMATASSLGSLSSATPTRNGFGDIGFNASFGRDIHDFWKFSVSGAFKTSLSLTGLTANAGLALYNSAGNLLTYSNAGGNTSESITRWLGTGDYYALVYSYTGWGGSTNYNLGVQAGTQLSSLINDYTVNQAVATSITDGQISRNDMINILRSTKDYGSVHAEEFTDLKDILNDANSFGMQDYVQNLSKKVVYGDLANATSGFGNLFAGSSATQMENLVGKWFLGNDRPDAAGTYRYTQGSLFQGGISINDVNQGAVGDCYFMATLGALAVDKPTTIQNMFIDNGDGTFTVRFMKNGVADYVTVDRYLPTYANGTAIYAGWNGGANTETNNELWVALAEKAYAQVNESGWIGRDNTNSYSGLNGGWMDTVMNQITGLGTSSKYVSSMTKTELINLLNSNKLLTAGFVHGGGFGVVNSHAYTVTGYNGTTGKFFLHNPWGNTHAEVTWEQLGSLKAIIQNTLA